MRVSTSFWSVPVYTDEPYVKRRRTVAVCIRLSTSLEQPGITCFSIRKAFSRPEAWSRIRLMCGRQDSAVSSVTPKYLQACLGRSRVEAMWIRGERMLIVEFCEIKWTRFSFIRINGDYPGVLVLN